MQVKVYNKIGEENGEMELPDAVFGLKWNADLVHQVVTSQAANRRRPIAHAKDRSEVRGGGKKPWRQKGTGRARHGSIRSPIWIGGGVTHGPRNEKNFKKKINKSMARKALYTVLSAKARDHEIAVMEAIGFPEPKTKYANVLFSRLAKHKELEKITRGRGVLVALSEKNPNARRAMKNIPYVSVEEARNLNAYDALRYTCILFPKSALENFRV